MSVDWDDVIKWGIAAGVSIVIAASITSCIDKDREAKKVTQEKVAEAIKSGVDPILAGCTYDPPYSDSDAADRCAIAQALNESRK